MDCSLPGFSVHGIFQARVLEWVAISFSGGSSRPRDRTRVSRIVGRRFTHWATREAWIKQMVFWNSLAFSVIQRMLAIWCLVPLPFLKPACTSGSSQFTYCWILDWRILSLTLLVWDECNCAVVWAFFAVAFLWDWNENWPFPVLWPLLSFSNLLAYW